MYLFYVDESGNTGADLDSPDQPIHWLLALGVNPRALRAVEAELFALALRHFPDRARSADFEFHGANIYGRREECRGWPPEQAVGLYRELMEIIGRHECGLFITGIDKQKLKRRAALGNYQPAHPYKLGFMFLVERIDQWLQDRQPEEDFFGEADPLYGLLVADEQKEVDRQIIASFAYWRDRRTEYSWQGRSIQYLIDTVHYVPSHDSWLIQMADCLAYLWSRYHKVKREKGEDEGGYTLAEAAVVRLWDEYCENRVEKYYLWP